jgi:hypothetical protein
MRRFSFLQSSAKDPFHMMVRLLKQQWRSQTNLNEELFMLFP